MSDNRPIGNLSTYDARDWVTGESITRSKLQNEFDQIDDLIDQIKQALSDIQSRRSNSGHSATENTIEGQIVHDSDSGLWYGDPDGSGADDQLATELSTYQGDYANAGTDTFKIGGMILSSGDISNDQQISAGVLSRNGAYIELLGRASAANPNALNLSFRLDDSIQHTVNLPLTGAINGIVRAFFIRTGATSQKWIVYGKDSRDAGGSTTLAKVGSSSKTMSSAIAVEITDNNIITPANVALTYKFN